MWCIQRQMHCLNANRIHSKCKTNFLRETEKADLEYHLHWLQATERILFKLCCLVYKAIHGLGPCYLNELCIPVLTVPNLSALRSVLVVIWP